MSSFMQPQIVEDWWVVVDSTMGTQYVPIDLVGVEWQDGMPLAPAFEDLEDYLEVSREENVYSIECQYGYGARMSAPGYLDCTEWTVFETAKEAAEYLLEYEGSSEPEYEEDWEKELREQHGLEDAE